MFLIAFDCHKDSVSCMIKEHRSVRQTPLPPTHTHQTIEGLLLSILYVLNPDHGKRGRTYNLISAQ